MPKVDLEKFYGDSIDTYGINAKGLGWRSQESQELRFAMLLKLLPEDLSRVDIVDAGCGFGDFYHYASEMKTLGGYIGLEASMQVIKNSYHGLDLRYCNVLKDTLENADFYICSGAMNTLTRFETVLFIQRCFLASNQGFVFNILRGTKRSDTYNYFMPKEVLKLGNSLGAVVRIKEGYMDNDMTVAFYKPIT